MSKEKMLLSPDEMSNETADTLFHCAQEIHDNIRKEEQMDFQIVEEFVAEQLLLLGIRSEFLTIGLTLNRVQLKNIQRKLEKQGLLVGVINTKRTLETFDRSAQMYLSKGRVVVALLLRFYELLNCHSQSDRLNLHAFAMAYSLTQEIFEHPQIGLPIFPTLSVDLAFFFCLEQNKQRVEPIFCSHCGQIYPAFALEVLEKTDVHCPFCQLLTNPKFKTLRQKLKTGFGT